MKRFMVRVELHNARTAQQYEQLHAHMAQHGIYPVIVADDGRRFRLPPAEYYYVGNATRGQVLAASKQAAAAVDHLFAVVVTEASGVTWEGLKLVA